MRAGQTRSKASCWHSLTLRGGVAKAKGLWVFFCKQFRGPANSATIHSPSTHRVEHTKPGMERVQFEQEQVRFQAVYSEQMSIDTRVDARRAKRPRRERSLFTPRN